jgi:site-specific DNA recombinase
MTMKNDKESKKVEALIYCRVSSEAQKLDGDGLHSQEHRCRQYAAARNYVVEKVFHDVKTAGGDFMKRPGMVALLQHLRQNAHTNYVVIFDDLKRFARDTEFHIRLRTKLAQYGAVRECLNFKFEDTPEGKFIETIIAAQGELERVQNQRQTVQKMKARVERGYHAFKACVGYKYIDTRERGRVLVRDEPFATICERRSGTASF